MPIHVDQLIEVLAQLSEKEDLKIAVKSSVKGGLVTGLSAVAGGLLLGRVGLVVGGALGGVCSALIEDELKPVATIIRNLTFKEKRQLMNSLEAAFRDFGINDILTLSSMLMANRGLHDLVIEEMLKFLNDEKNKRILA